MGTFRTALVLSGGAARGLAHIGTIAELDKYKIDFDIIVGTSMGSIIGALYALYRDPKKIYEYVYDYLNSELFQRNWLPVQEGESVEGGAGFFHRFLVNLQKSIYYTRSLTRLSLITSENYEEMINAMFEDVLIEDMPVKYGAVAIDLTTGEEVVICSGPLRKAIAASCAIPGVLPPIEIEGRLLVDGGGLDNLPIIPALEMGGSFVVASDASWDIKDLELEVRCALDIVFRTNDITRLYLNEIRRSIADLLIEPRVGHIQWTEFNRMAEVVAAGRKAARVQLRTFRWKKLQFWLYTFGGLTGRKPPNLPRNIVYI